MDGLSIESEGDFTKYEKANGTTIDGQEECGGKGILNLMWRMHTRALERARSNQSARVK